MKLPTRYEIKYRISPRHAQAVSEWLKNVMEPDANGEGGSPIYNVHSLYLDGDDWSIYQDTDSGLFRRFKLRARTYTFRDDSPVFLEVKQRAGESMWKSRGEVSRAEAIRLLKGEPSQEPITPAVAEFLAQRDLRDAKSKAWVTYRREAWLAPDRGQMVRVTFDTKIRCAPPTEDLSEPPIWYRLPEVRNVSVLELKFAGSYPGWIAEMVRIFDLERKSMSKYRYAVEVLRSSEAELAKLAEPSGQVSENMKEVAA